MRAPRTSSDRAGALRAEPAAQSQGIRPLIAGAVVGFTGTQRGLTSAQEEVLLSALIGFREGGSLWMRNGDCIGADERAGKLWATLGGKVHLHPPRSEAKRAFLAWDRCEPRAPYLDRNRAIVHASKVLVATPGEQTEQQRGGTWYTIRRARGRSKPIMLIYPDGTFALENWPAQAIEARRAETGTGSVEDESAVAKPCAQTDPSSPSCHGRA